MALNTLLGGKGRDPLPLRALDAGTQLLNIGGTLLIVALMLLIGADVACRNLLNAPISGVPEMVTLSIVAIVFLQSPQALRSGRFPRSDAFQPVLERRFPRAGRALWDAFDLLGGLVVGIILYATWPIFVRAVERADYIGAVGDFTAPVWPVKLAVLLGSLFLLLQFLANIVRRHSEKVKP